MKVYKADNGKKKISALAICLLLTVVMTVAGTLAYLTTATNAVKNTFTPAKVGNFVDEEFDGTTKTDVKIENSISGDITDIVDAYIRAKVLFTWRDGVNVLPADTDDYEIKWIEDGWDYCESDGYYYYTGVVKPGKDTGVLFTDCKPVDANAPGANYKLHVEIVSQSIQAQPTIVVVNQWGVALNGTTISK